MFTSGYLIRSSAAHPYNLFAVYVPIVLTRAFGIGRPVFRYLERLLSHNWVLRMTSGIRKQLYVVLEKDAVFFSQRHRVGDMLGILSDDIDRLQNMYLVTIFPSIIALFVYMVLVISFGIINLAFGAIIALLFGTMLFLSPLISLRMERRRKERQKTLRADSYRAVTDAVMGAYDWLISGRKQGFVTRSNAPAKKLNTLLRRSRQFERRRTFLLHIIFSLIVVIVLFWATQQFSSGGGVPNWIAAWVLALFPLFDVFVGVNQSVTSWPLYETSIKRLNAVQPHDEQFPAQVPVPTQWESLHINNISFRYDATSSLLKNLDLVIPRGTKLAILGRSGAGKSTLLKLLTGNLEPTKGTILLDTTPIRQLHDYQSTLFGVLNQHPFLFNTSILNNVRLGNLTATDADVRTALERAGLGDLIKSLPEGMDTLVEENGSRFSGGEQQRIALARILVQNTPIIILDEPTVGLDPITEQSLIDTIFTVCADKTVIWVTHHLQGVERADTVIFIENGTIAMSDSPQMLYETSDRFKHLYNLDHGVV
jgi:ATP-binding cassette subfamily C protein CydC